MIDRLVKMFTKPDEYWNEAIAEPGDIKSMLIPQMAILAAIPAVAQFLGMLFNFMRFSFGLALVGGLVSMILGYALSLGVWILFGYIIDMLAGTFNAQRDIGQSMKLAAGAVIPAWVGSILYLVPIPALGMLGQLAGFGYGAYLLFKGLPTMNSTPQDKAVAYTVVSIVILIVVSFVLGFLISCPVTACIAGSAMHMGPGAM